MYYNPMYQQPYMNQPATQLVNTLIRVTGIEGARAYQMAPNSVVALFDNAADIFYVKTTDGAGFGTIRTFSFTEVSNKVNAPNTEPDKNYVSREEFETFKKEVLEYAEQSVQKQSYTKQ